MFSMVHVEVLHNNLHFLGGYDFINPAALFIFISTSKIMLKSLSRSVTQCICTFKLSISKTRP